MLWLLRYLPRNHLSWVTGRLAQIRLPEPFAGLLVRWFARRYKIDLSIAAKPVSEYPSIGALFTRELAPGLRPVCGRFVAPVDGTLRNGGPIGDGWLEQIKDKRYSLENLLKSRDSAACYRNGYYFNYYLSPQDYHHVHSPVTGTIVEMVYIPGTLWPVNDWSLKSIPDLFTVNERVIIYIESEFGRIAVVMVGATNVGKISLTFDALLTNQGQRDIIRTEYGEGNSIRAGDKLGSFHLGSSVVVLCPASSSADLYPHVEPNRKVLYGSTIVP